MQGRVFWAGFFGLTLSAAVAAGSISAPPSQPTTTSPVSSSAQNVVAQISALSNDLRAQSEVVKALQQQLSLLLAQRPKDPGPDASDDARKAYQQSLAEWSKRVDALKAQLQSAIAKLDDIRKRLDALASTALPSALAKDVEAARKSAAEARAAGEKVLAEATRVRDGGVKPPPRQPISPAPAPAPASPPPT